MNIGGNSDVESIFKNAIACLNKTSIDNLGTYEEEMEKQKTVQIIIKSIIHEVGGIQSLSKLDVKEMNKHLKKCRARFNDLFTRDEYNLCIRELIYYTEWLKENNIDIKFNNYFINDMYSKCYFKENEYELSIKYGKKALRYAEMDIHFAITYVSLSEAYEHNNNLKKQIKYIDLAYNYFEKMGNKKECLNMLNNKAWYTNNIELANKVVNDYIELRNNEECNDEELDNAYSTLCTVYINNNDLINAEQVFNKVILGNTRTKLKERLENSLQMNEKLAVNQ